MNFVESAQMQCEALVPDNAHAQTALDATNESLSTVDEHCATNMSTLDTRVLDSEAGIISRTAAEYVEYTDESSPHSCFNWGSSSQPNAKATISSSKVTTWRFE